MKDSGVPWLGQSAGTIGAFGEARDHRADAIERTALLNVRKRATYIKGLARTRIRESGHEADFGEP